MAQIYFHGSDTRGARATSPRPWFDTITAAWHRILDDVSNPYRPELHYMRGPGPKWNAKYRGQSGAVLHHPVEENFPVLHFHNP